MGSGLWRSVGALALIVLGLLLLLNALGITGISVGDIFVGAFAVMAILVGMTMLRRSRRPPRGALTDQFLGTMRAGAGWQGGSASYQLGVGEMVLDLTKADLPDGEHAVSINGLVGRLDVLVPRELPLSLDGEVTVGSVQVLGQRADGLFRSLSFTSPGYATAPRSLRLTAELTIGEIRVRYAQE